MRTSITHPLQVDWLQIEGDKGCIGMTLCPGKFQPVSWTGGWERQLSSDIEALVQYGTDQLVSLITDDDMEVLRVTDLPQTVRENGLEWIHLPIEDTTVPTRRWLENALPVYIRLFTSIQEGERVVVHCMGGLSRAGTFVAIYLYLRGFTMTEAIAKIRLERDPRCINQRQLEFLFALEDHDVKRLTGIQEPSRKDWNIR